MTALTPALWPAGTAAEDIARAARVGHCAVRAAAGPHTTPVAVTWSAGWLWFLTPRASVKARAVRDGAVAVLLRGPDGALVVRGRALLLDPLRPDLRPGALVRCLPAAVRYARTQWDELSTIPREALRLLLEEGDPTALRPRCAVAMAPHEALMLSGTGATVDLARWGEPALAPTPLSRRHTPRSPSRPATCVPRLGPALSRLLLGRSEAVLTVDTPAGPLPLPAVWEGERGVVTLADTTAALLPARPRSPGACVTLTDREEPGVRGKSGLLLRGVARVRAGGRELDLRPERVTWWRGTAAGTLPGTALAEVRGHHVR